VCECVWGVFGPAVAVNKHSDAQQDQWWWQQGSVCVCRDSLLPLETRKEMHTHARTQTHTHTHTHTL